MTLTLQETRSSAGVSEMHTSTTVSIADTTTPLKSPTKEASSSDTHPPKHKFGFSDIAKLFIRMRRHQRRASISRKTTPGGTEESEVDQKPSTSPTQHETTSGPAKIASSPLADVANGTPRSGGNDATYPPVASRSVTPPPTPHRIQIRHFGTHSMFHGGKSKSNHLCSSSGDEPISHPGMKESMLFGVQAIPVEYTDRFDCVGGVNAVTLLRATRNTLLETVEEFLGANALVDELWDCTICGPKHGGYKVEISYSASATRCSRPDPHRPVALDRVKGIPGLMTIVKREDV
ncbi:hypothetical protein D9611_010476 [Ephemerocybe angulata]|uniref:Uncharacterized protein n=1 Tax=Ephemerocybe angulata TaxID=980116 RepID=A0A8H5FAQ7_9AGAR|nr:hypothetical protein D9611_010476 [Tulosesus angulatus]